MTQWYQSLRRVTAHAIACMFAVSRRVGDLLPQAFRSAYVLYSSRCCRFSCLTHACVYTVHCGFLDGGLPLVHPSISLWIRTAATLIDASLTNTWNGLGFSKLFLRSYAESLSTAWCAFVRSIQFTQSKHPVPQKSSDVLLFDQLDELDTGRARRFPSELHLLSWVQLLMYTYKHVP